MEYSQNQTWPLYNDQHLQNKNWPSSWLTNIKVEASHSYFGVWRRYTLPSPRSTSDGLVTYLTSRTKTWAGWSPTYVFPTRFQPFVFDWKLISPHPFYNTFNHLYFNHLTFFHSHGILHYVYLNATDIGMPIPPQIRFNKWTRLVFNPITRLPLYKLVLI